MPKKPSISVGQLVQALMKTKGIKREMSLLASWTDPNTSDENPKVFRLVGLGIVEDIGVELELERVLFPKDKKPAN